MPHFLYLVICWWTSRLVPVILNRTAVVTDEPVALWEPLNFLIISLRVVPIQFEYWMQTNSGKSTGYPQEPPGGKTECMWRKEDHIHKGEACLNRWGCEDFHEDRGELGSQLARSRRGHGDFRTAHKWRKEVLCGWRQERVRDKTSWVRLESWIDWGPNNLRS